MTRKSTHGNGDNFLKSCSSDQKGAFLSMWGSICNLLVNAKTEATECSRYIYRQMSDLINSVHKSYHIVTVIVIGTNVFAITYFLPSIYQKKAPRMKMMNNINTVYKVKVRRCKVWWSSSRRFEQLGDMHRQCNPIYGDTRRQICFG